MLPGKPWSKSRPHKRTTTPPLGGKISIKRPRGERRARQPQLKHGEPRRKKKKYFCNGGGKREPKKLVTSKKGESPQEPRQINLKEKGGHGEKKDCQLGGEKGKTRLRKNRNLQAERKTRSGQEEKIEDGRIWAESISSGGMALKSLTDQRRMIQEDQGWKFQKNVTFAMEEKKNQKTALKNDVLYPGRKPHAQGGLQTGKGCLSRATKEGESPRRRRARETCEGNGVRGREKRTGGGRSFETEEKLDSRLQPQGIREGVVKWGGCKRGGEV